MPFIFSSACGHTPCSRRRSLTLTSAQDLSAFAMATSRSGSGGRKRAASRPDVAKRKKPQKATEHSTVKCGVNRIGMRGDLRKRIKSDAARLQTVSFIGTRFAQFVLLRDLKSGEDRFRYDPDEEGVDEQTFWDQCLNAVTNHGEKNELDTIFKNEFKGLLPGDWQQVESKHMFPHIQQMRIQLRANAETMIATTFHRRIREGLHLQLLSSRLRHGVELNNKADVQLSFTLTGAITRKEGWEGLLPSNKDVSDDLCAFLTYLVAVMDP